MYTAITAKQQCAKNSQKYNELQKCRMYLCAQNSQNMESTLMQFPYRIVLNIEQTGFHLKMNLMKPYETIYYFCKLTFYTAVRAITFHFFSF